MGSRQANLCPRPPLAAGLDEAGRGCLAGPVVAAAVILPQYHNLPGLADSKLLSPARREDMERRIKACAEAFAVHAVWPARIKRVNILNASLEAMAHAAARLAPLPDLLLVDGNKPIGESILMRIWPTRPLPRQKTIVHGDALVPAISAASILAKTYRDRLMTKLARRWPGYGFEKHKGYGTRAHLLALAALGSCPLHRQGFRGVPERRQLALAPR